MRKVVFILCCVALASCSYRSQLTQFLHEFEELGKEHIYLEHVTNFTVPSAMKMYLRIEMKDITFHAAVQPHVDLFHPDLVVKQRLSDVSDSGALNIHEYLEGTLIDEPYSRVLIHIKDNVVTGSIQTSEREKYFIEPSDKHVKEPHDFHMIAYKLSDVKFNFTKPEEGGHFCGHESHQGQDGFTDDDFDFMIPKKQAPLEDEGDGISYARKKRATEKKNRCPLALIGDYTFYKDLNKGEEANAINYMIGLIQQIDPLYQQQSLDRAGKAEFENYGFSIKYIEVIKEDDIDLSDPNSHKYWTSGHNPGVSQLLKNFAYGDWGDYCLAHLFSNYDFSGGVLGLAYVASASTSRVGGVCTRTYKDGSGRTKHLNVGLTTSVNYGRTLLTSELVFVTGHEFGHNWGSSHDSDTSRECAPAGNRYMMYPAAVDGSQSNNYKFSPCSRQAINDVLVSKSDICFAKASAGVCGNGYVEEGEECDPGRKNTPCCNDCKLTQGSLCEDSNEECCSNCRYDSGAVCLATGWGTGDSIYCHRDHTCQLESETNKYVCTEGVALSDGTSCYDNGKCSSGECQNICVFNGKLPCRCADDTDLCKECCQDSKETTCDVFESGRDLADGVICGNGHCVAGTCEIGAQDIQEKFWEVIDALDVNMVLRWFRNNIVFTIIVFSCIFWIPISFFVDWLDDKYDLGVLDDILGSSSGERKTEDKKRLVQENTTV